MRRREKTHGKRSHTSYILAPKMRLIRTKSDFPFNLSQSIALVLVLMSFPLFRTVNSQEESLPSDLYVPASNIAIMTIAKGDKYNLMGRLAHKNHAHFAEMNKVDYINAGHYTDDILPGQWFKIKALIDYLPMFKWIMWMDADSLVCGWDLNIFKFIGMADPLQDVVIGADLEGSIFNSGVFWIRNSTWSLNFLRRVLERGYLDPFTRYHPFFEQLAMQDLFRNSPEIRRHFLVIPNSMRHEFNSYIIDNSYRRPGMKVLHDAGCRLRLDAQMCQLWYRSYYCMCTHDRDSDPECATDKVIQMT